MENRKKYGYAERAAGRKKYPDYIEAYQYSELSTDDIWKAIVRLWIVEIILLVRILFKKQLYSIKTFFKKQS